MPENTGQAESKPKREFVKYQELSKDELVKMLMRVNKRLTRVNKELKEIINILYYGDVQGEGQNSGYRGKYGKKPGRQRRSEGEDEDVNYE
jgi:hypothetical protein